MLRQTAQTNGMHPLLALLSDFPVNLPMSVDLEVMPILHIEPREFFHTLSE